MLGGAATIFQKNQKINSAGKDYIMWPRKYSLLLLYALLVCSCSLKKNEERMKREGYSVINQTDVFGRKIRKFILPNSLKVVLIEEKDSQFAAGALSFNVGANQDPAENQGLAHFLEHMIFISSKNYPEVDSFQKFVKAQGGMTNAFTAGDRTVFFYTVSNESCLESIKRFGDLFANPLIQDQFTEKEVQAVNSESKKNLENDAWREWRLLGLAAQENHPWRQYSTGNSETLKNANAKIVTEFMKTYYSAGGATLVLLSSQPLDTMEENLATVFGSLENKQKTPPELQAPFTENKKPNMIEMVPVKDLEEMTLYFQTPAQKKQYKAKIPRLVSYFIGDEGEGSLFSYLQKEGLVTKLFAGLSENYETFSLFEIQLQLTKKGLQQYERVIEEIFAYIHVLQTQGMQKYHWEDLQKLARIDYENQEKGSPVNEVLRYTSAIKEYPLESLEEDSFLIKEYNPELFQNFLNTLTVSNLTIVFKSRSIKATQTEPIYGTQYALTTLKDSLVKKIAAQKLSQHYKLPQKNNFIAEAFSLVAHKETAKPIRIIDNEWGKAWLQNDTLFKKPRASILLNVYIAKGIQSARESVLLNLYIQSLNYLLTEYLYPIETAGVSVALEPCSYDQCFSLKLDGYSDKILDVLESMASRLSINHLEKDAFTHIFEAYSREKRNEVYNDAYRQVLGIPELFFIKKTYSFDEFLKELETVSYDELLNYSKDLLSHIHIKATYFGNLHQEKIEKSFNACITTLQKDYASKPQTSVYQAEFLKYQKQKAPFVYSLPRPVNNSANLNAFYYPVKDAQTRAAFRVFSSWLAPEFFAELRTKKQLGYVASAQLRLLNDQIPLFFFLLQSSEYTRKELNTESYQFIENMLTEFNKLDTKHIEEFKKGVIAQLLEDPKTFDEANNRLWLCAFKLQEQFNYHIQEAHEVQNLTKEKIVAILDTAFKKDTQGSLFSFQIQGTFDKTQTIEGFTSISKIYDFKTTYGKNFE